MPSALLSQMAKRVTSCERPCLLAPTKDVRAAADCGHLRDVTKMCVCVCVCEAAGAHASIITHYLFRSRGEDPAPGDAALGAPRCSSALDMSPLSISPT